jgi:hypothetical protein
MKYLELVAAEDRMVVEMVTVLAVEEEDSITRNISLGCLLLYEVQFYQASIFIIS